MTTAYFTGECKWAKVYKPDDKYQKYSIDVLLDMEQYEEFQKFKFKTPGKLDNGKFWVTMRRKVEDGAPVVVDKEGNPFTDTIGNGSIVTVKIDTYNYDNKFGKGTGFKIVGVQVDEHKQYVKPEADSSSEKVMPSVSTPRPRIPF